MEVSAPIRRLLLSVFVGFKLQQKKLIHHEIPPFMKIVSANSWLSQISCISIAFKAEGAILIDQLRPSANYCSCIQVEKWPTPLA